MSNTAQNRYGYWLVLSAATSTTSLCRCECGTERVVANNSLRRGASSSCGCRKADLFLQKRRPKYLYREVEWVAWQSMVHRCMNPRAKAWSYYGARGITVCERWLNGEAGSTGYECFLADMGRRPEGRFSLERKDVDTGYGPDNCCWLPLGEQASNTRRNRLLDHEGEVYTAAQFAEKLGLPHKTVLYRLDKGWTPQEIAERPHGWRPSKYARRS